MEQAKAKPRYNAGKRIRRLGIGIVIAIAVWTAGWYWIAGRVDAGADHLLAAQRERGTAIDCVDREVRGYPFRLEVFCTSLDFARPADGLAIEAGGLRGAAQVYDPQRIYAELDSPVTVESALAGSARIDWSLARATATLADPVPQRGSISIDDIEVAFDGLEAAISAAHAEAHMRLNDADLDLALRYEGLVVDPALSGGRRLPVLAGDADLSVDDGAAFAASGITSLRGLSGDLRRLALLLTPKQGLLVSGTYAVGADGLLDAELEAIIVDPDGVAGTMKPVFPEYASQIEMLGALPVQDGPDGTPEVKVPVTVRDGRIALGFIPIGQLPPLD
ncbi:DUF2125 domain-containing protein [Oricola indica]|uniref:DUF2125 domain-containing protein n=1 Tax=Oricola indica TaxID=2872591 RepID=UPI003CCBCACC